MPSSMSNVLLSIDRLQRCKTAAEVQGLLEKLLHRYEIDAFTSALIERLNDDEPPAVNWRGTIEPSWFEHYTSNHMEKHDWALRYHAEGRARGPFFNGEAFLDRIKGLTEAEKDVCRASAEVGMRSAWIVPMWLDVNGQRLPGGFSLWSGADRNEFTTMIEEFGTEILLYLNVAKEQMLLNPARGDDGVTLSPRERDCLTLLAQGYRPEEIGDRMRLATVTVYLHLRTARLKLDAKTMPEAVARAMALAKIAP